MSASGPHPEARRLLNLLNLAVSLLVAAVGSSTLAQTPTTTTLAVSSNGNPVSTVSAGTQITLTATVQAGATPLKQGQVNFCDATATHCLDIHLLGAAQLNSAGKAQLDLRPGPGSNSYKAEFVGTPKSPVPYAGSISTVVTLNVTGKFPSATAISQGGSSGAYTLTASVYGFTKSKSTQTPTGTISFVDTTTNNSLLGMVTLASSGSGPIWVQNSLALGNEPGSVVVGDFNRDGNLDLAVGLNSTTNTVAVLLGDGGGSFSPVTSSLITADGNPVLVQDFNSDGIPDLLLSSQLDGTLTVLLGNGDGTFTEAPGSPISTHYGSFPVVAADFNGDGIPDLAVAGGNYLVVLLGNGDGTFTPMPITSSTIAGAADFASMVAGDFNGDGIADLAVIDLSDETVSIFLGNGDGTFRQGSSITVNTTSAGSNVNLTTADFNGDGKLDLAVPINESNGSAAILLGNGDGTFQPATGSPFAVGTFSSIVAVGDFNGDGIADLFFEAHTSATDIFVFLGKGDGTFIATSTGSTRLPCCSPAALADFNGDGVTDIASTDFYSGVADIFLTALQESVATTAGISVAGQTPQQVIASYPGDTNYVGGESASTSLHVQAAAPVFTPASRVLAPSQSITLASATPGATIYYQASGLLQTNGFIPYSGPISVSTPGSLTLQAYAVATNYGQSVTITASYTVTASTPPNPAPVVSTLSPAFATAGVATFPISIGGSGFVSVSTAYWGKTALATQYVSATQITAQVTAAEAASAGITPVTVQTPAPGGGISNSLQFELDSGGPGTSPSFATTAENVKAGSTASFSVTLPSAATDVTVSCLNLPGGATCSYSSSAGALTIATSASTPLGSYQITAVFNETLPVNASAIVLAPFLLWLLLLRNKQRKKHPWALTVLILALCCFAISSCGGGSSSAPAPPPPPAPTHQVTGSAVVTLRVQ